MSCNQEMTPAQKATSDKLDKKIAEYGSLSKWLAWEREHNPNFKEVIHTEMAKPSQCK